MGETFQVLVRTLGCLPSVFKEPDSADAYRWNKKHPFTILWLMCAIADKVRVYGNSTTALCHDISFCHTKKKLATLSFLTKCHF